MKCWRRCRLQYHLKYVVGAKPTKTSLGLVRGAVGHAALGQYYKGAEPDDVVQGAFDDWAINYKLGADKDWEILEAVLYNYMAWADVHDDFQETLAIEQFFNLQIGGHQLIGYIDGIVRDRYGHIWLLEHKFNKQVSTKHLDMDPQVSIYMLAAIKLGFDPQGVKYNIIRIGSSPEKVYKHSEPVVRTDVYRHLEGLETKAKELEYQMGEMQRFHDKGGAIYRNETHDCHWDCDYYSICLGAQFSGSLEPGLSRMLPNKEKE